MYTCTCIRVHVHLHVHVHVANLTCTLVSPTNLLKNHKETAQALSLLLLTTRCSTAKAHFDHLQPPPKVPTAIEYRLKADLEHLEITVEHDGRVVAAMSEILANKQRLVSFGRNEADTRYAMCDPTMSVVCRPTMWCATPSCPWCVTATTTHSNWRNL